MVKCNDALLRLSKHYLFSAIQERRCRYEAAHPHADVISLGIGDTTGPLPPAVADAFSATAARYATSSGYRGYGPDQGDATLREAIAATLYHGRVAADEIFISDGSKCDAGRLQLLFGSDAVIAVQDPSYPVYLDTTIASGKAPPLRLPCTPDNAFFPDLDACRGADILYFTSPNNPTGVAATHSQLEALVAHAQRERMIILYDSAYAAFIRDSTKPRSIFEIAGAESCAIEMGSFSKMAAFTGIRLGWTVVPHRLQFDDGAPVIEQWKRITTTFFNGASALAQQGGIAALKENNSRETAISSAIGNCTLMRQALKPLGFRLYGGSDCPYLWACHPHYRDSWELFDLLLNELAIVTTPGIGFGPSGAGFIRFSGFATPAHTAEACQRFEQLKSRLGALKS